MRILAGFAAVGQGGEFRRSFTTITARAIVADCRSTSKRRIGINGTMDQAAFVELLRKLVVEAAAADTIAQIAAPSGRNLSAERKGRAAWFNGLSADERANVECAVVDAAMGTVFGLLCVLDGARAIENGPDRGYLELRYINAASDTLLASGAPDMPTLPLHEFI